MTDSDTTGQQEDLGGAPTWPQPSGWKYSWLGGFDPGAPIQPLETPAGWQPLRRGDARLQVAPSPLHEHTADCFGDDSQAIRDTLEGVGWVCNVTARFPTQWGEDGRPLRYDTWVWYPFAVVERYRG